MGRFFSRFQDLSADILLALLIYQHNTKYMLFLFELLRNVLIPDWDQKKEVVHVQWLYTTVRISSVSTDVFFANTGPWSKFFFVPVCHESILPIWSANLDSTENIQWCTRFVVPCCAQGTTNWNCLLANCEWQQCQVYTTIYPMSRIYNITPISSIHNSTSNGV
jgi:hypothetical protein